MADRQAARGNLIVSLLVRLHVLTSIHAYMDLTTAMLIYKFPVWTSPKVNLFEYVGLVWPHHTQHNPSNVAANDHLTKAIDLTLRTCMHCAHKNRNIEATSEIKL